MKDYVQVGDAVKFKDDVTSAMKTHVHNQLGAHAIGKVQDIRKDEAGRFRVDVDFPDPVGRQMAIAASDLERAPKPQSGPTDKRDPPEKD
jgi:hypothetical protein